MTTAARGRERWLALDGVRGLAAAWVVLGHYQVPFFSEGGSLGVDVFFVLSGFLITGILLEQLHRDGRIWFGHFYLRRARRLYPALLLLLAGAAVWAWANSGSTDAVATLRGVPVAATYLTDGWLAFRVAPLAALDHTWTLAIEEQFYLIWPVVLLLLVRSRWRDRLGPVLLIGIGAIALYRVGITAVWRSYPRTYFAFDTRADQLLVGCLLAVVYRDGWLATHVPANRRPWVLSIGVAVICFLTAFGIPVLHAGNVTGFDAAMPLGGYTAVALVAAAVIGVLVLGGTPRAKAFLSLPAVVWLGTISYGIYLWHYLVRYAFPIDTSSPMSQTLTTSRDVLVTLGLACASYYGVERYVLGRGWSDPSPVVASNMSLERATPPPLGEQATEPN